MRRVRFTLVALFIGCMGYGQSSSQVEYARLTTSASLPVHVVAGKPGHFTVQVEEGHPARISADQRLDILFRWQKDGEPAREIDSFQFGPETATLRESGTYVVETILAAGKGEATAIISRQDVPEAEAELWEKAEEQATKAKRSRLNGDILAALDLWKKMGQSGAIARTLLEYGDYLNGKSDIAGARDAYEEALAICLKASETRCIAEAANNAGLEHDVLGDFAPALDRLELAEASWKKLSEIPYMGRTLSNLGFLFRRVGDFQRAIAYYHQARLIEQGIDSISYAKVLNNLGVCYLELNENGRAISYLNSALDIYKLHPSPSASARARLNLGRAWMFSGDFKKADAKMSQSLEEAGNDDATRADVLNNLGQLAWRRKQYAESEHFLSQALQLELRLSDRRGQASALHYLGLISAAAGEWTKAIDQLEQAVKLRTQLQLRDEAADSLYEIATLQYQHGNSETARKLVEDAISLLELVRRQVPTPGLRAAFYSSKRRLFDLLQEITMTGAGARPAEAGLLLAERGRGRALLDLLAEGSVLRQLPPEFLRRRQELQRRISFLVFHLSSNSKERQEDIQRRLDLLLAEDAEAEAGVRQILNKQRLGVPLTSLEILRHTLPSDTALMEYYLGQHQSYLWLVNAQGIHLYFLPSSRVIEPVVANTAKLFENILDRRRFPEKQAMFEQGLDQLSRILLGKLKGQTLPQRLVIVPDGALYRVPFAALKLPGEKKELGLTHDLIQAPSAGYLMAGRRPRSIHDFPQSVVALADPVFSVKDPRVTPASASSAVSQGQNFARLAFGPELGVISALPEPRRKVLRGFEASRDALSHLPLQNFGLVYFASHAIIEDRLPELSRVVLTQVEQNGRPVDGFLRPYHLAKLRLDGSIVVLSGCETALGKQIVGEGLEGFSSSLFAAGASQLVLALDNIDAEASSEFFARTFASYLSPSGPSMERSMTLARRQMSESQSWSDVYYWASFVVIGRPTEVSRHAASGALSQHSKQMEM